MTTNLSNTTLTATTQQQRRTQQQPLFLTTWTMAVFVFLYLPIVVLILLSFNQSTILSLPFIGITLNWYKMAFADTALQDALINSLRVAVVATVIATLLGLLSAFAIYRYQFFGKNTFRIAITLPILLPGVVTGVAMLAYFSNLGLELSLGTVILGHLVFGLPVAMGPILTRLTQFPQMLEEAAYDLGARPKQVFLDIIFPYIRSAVISGALLAFTLSFDEVIVTIFLTGRENTLPMEIWARLRTDITPEIAATATLILMASTVLILLNQVITSRQPNA